MVVVDSVDLVVVDDDDELLVELGIVEVVVLVLVVLDVVGIEVVDWVSERRQPLAGGWNFVGLLIGGVGRVVGVAVPDEVVVVLDVTVVDVVEPVAPVVVVPAGAVAPRSIRWKANPTTSRAASERFRTSRRGQRRGASSGEGGIDISWRTVTARLRRSCSSTGDDAARDGPSTATGRPRPLNYDVTVTSVPIGVKG